MVVHLRIALNHSIVGIIDLVRSFFDKSSAIALLNLKFSVAIIIISNAAHLYS